MVTHARFLKKNPLLPVPLIFYVQLKKPDASRHAQLNVKRLEAAISSSAGKVELLWEKKKNNNPKKLVDKVENGAHTGWMCGHRAESAVRAHFSA